MNFGLTDEQKMIQGDAHQTADHHEAVDAFIEKRFPSYKGE